MCVYMSTKRIVTRDDDVKTFTITCNTQRAKNDVFDVCEQHNIECVVYRAIYDAQRAQRARNIATLQRYASIYELRDDSVQRDNVLRLLRNIDNMNDDDVQKSVDAHRKHMKNA